MRGNMRMLHVLVASPKDARPGRDAIKRELEAWNNHRAAESGYILVTDHWEISAVPLVGQGGPQPVINAALVDRADIVFAVFYHRLGTATGRAVSGTAEEIQRSAAAGKFVHVYFNERQPRSVSDGDQFRALCKFRDEMDRTDLAFRFKSEDQLAGLARTAIEHDVRRLKKRSQQLSRVGVSGVPFTYTELSAGEEVFRPCRVTYNHHDDTASARNVTDRALDDVMVVAGPAPREFSVTLSGPKVITSYATASYQMPPGVLAKEIFPSPFYITLTWIARGGRRFGFQERFATWMEGPSAPL